MKIKLKNRLFVLIVVASILMPTIVFAHDYPQGMVSNWKFDEGSGTTAIDSVGTNYGTIYGATWVDGICGSGLSFDGVDDYIALSEISGSAYNDFTIAVWFKTDTDYSNIPPNSNYYDYYHTIFGSGIGAINIMPSEFYVVLVWLEHLVFGSIRKEMDGATQPHVRMKDHMNMDIVFLL